jgi:hypothetical protein
MGDPKIPLILMSRSDNINSWTNGGLEKREKPLKEYWKRLQIKSIF